MFNFIKQKLQKIYASVTSKLGVFFGNSPVDSTTLYELEKILIAADTGVRTTRTIINQLKTEHEKGLIKEGRALRKALAHLLSELLQKSISNSALSPQKIFVLVGINGSGKTTTVAKLAHLFKSQGKRVLLVAADTFRAAAIEQLSCWATQTNTSIVSGIIGQDPGAIVFAGCEKFKKEQFDVLIIDTAGRLHTKVNLMNELAKIKRIIVRHLPEYSITTLLTVDSMLGQNSFEQAKLFKESTDLQGIVLTKMDGSAKGGIIFAIADELSIPVTYITFGEQIDQIKAFNPQEFVQELLGNS